MLIIVFGQMGMGKSFAAKILSQDLGIPFFEGDSAIPAGESLGSPSAVDKFVRKYLIVAIEEQLKKNDNNLIVSYAFYREEHRKLIQEHFKDKTDVKFLHVKTSSYTQAQNLSAREYGYVKWIPFAIVSRCIAFQEPQLEHIAIEHGNGGKKELRKKFEALPFYKKVGLDDALEESKQEAKSSSKAPYILVGAAVGLFAYKLYQAYTKPEEAIESILRP